MSIIVGADIVPVFSNTELFERAAGKELIGEDLACILDNADYRIFNLEVPLTDEQTPIKKHGPSLIASTQSVAGMKAIGVNLFTLANNHIMDQGIQGLDSTLLTLNRNEISHVGAGANINEAQEGFFFVIGEKKYGVYACAEHEFSIASEKKPGANPFDPIESLDHIVTIKSQCDYLIVLYHGGKEQYRYPSPNLQRTCRKIIEKGADLVICQHSHCIGCKEEYRGRTIVYGQGNFLFTKKQNEYWDTGLLIQIDESNRIEYIPFRNQGKCIRMAKGKDADAILAAFEKRSNDIKQPGFIDEQYLQFANESISEYILYFKGIHNSILYRCINKMSGQKLRQYIVKKVKQKRGLGLRNYIYCEAHRELLLKGLEQSDK